MQTLKPFRFLRAFFCGLTMLFHCNVWYNGFKVDASSAEWKSFLRSYLFFPLSMGGINSVPVFFTISAFFVTFPLISRLDGVAKGGQQEPLAAMLFSRYLRLSVLLIVPILVGLLTDSAFYDSAGGLQWWKVLGYLGMFGNLLPEDLFGIWHVDSTLQQCWSIVTEFQGSAALLLLIPLIHRHVGLKTWPLHLLTLAGLVLRLYVVSRNPGCNNLIGTLSTFHPMSMVRIAPNTTILAIQKMHNLQLVDPPLSTNVCSMSQRDQLAHYARRVYTPVFLRITPFFVGAILAINYFLVVTHRSGASSKTLGWFLFVVSCVFLITLFLAPIDVDNLPPMVVQVLMEVCSHTLLSVAVAFVTFCALVPPEHPYHAPKLAKFMSADVWATPAKYSSWMFALQWIIINQLARCTNCPIGHMTGIFVTFAIMLILAPFCVLCRKCVELPVKAARKQAVRALTSL